MTELLVDEVHSTGTSQSLTIKSINNVPAIRFIVTYIDGRILNNLNSLLKLILDRYDQAVLYDTASLAVKELSTNASKANLRHYLSQSRGFETGKNELLSNNEFRSILAHDDLATWFPKLRSAGLKVEITFNYDENGLELSVKNGFSLAEKDRERLLNKLQTAATSRDLKMIHELHKGDAEGGGLGIAMVMNALRSSGFSPNALTYDVSPDSLTTAKIFFPFRSGALAEQS